MFSSTDMMSSPWRPSVSSPLNPSPIRSPSRDDHTSQRVVQSSPIQKPVFRFSSRPAKPNPVLRRREDVQEQRRKGFLQGVRQKADDKAWQRRDIEGQSLRASWLANIGCLSHDAPTFSDADIEDAMAHQELAAQSQDDDDMRQAIQEEDDLDFLVSAYEQQQRQSRQRQQQQQHQDQHHQRQPQQLSLEDEDDDYDDIFAELISRELIPSDPSADQSNQMDTSE